MVGGDILHGRGRFKLGHPARNPFAKLGLHGRHTRAADVAGNLDFQDLAAGGH